METIVTSNLIGQNNLINQWKCFIQLVAEVFIKYLCCFFNSFTADFDQTNATGICQQLGPIWDLVTLLLIRIHLVWHMISCFTKHSGTVITWLQIRCIVLWCLFHLDDSYKWWNIEFGDEIGIKEIKMCILSGALFIVSRIWGSLYLISEVYFWRIFLNNIGAISLLACSAHLAYCWYLWLIFGII